MAETAPAPAQARRRGAGTRSRPTTSPRRLGVDPAAGLAAAKAAELLQKNGPNALPAEKAAPGWRRFLDQYRAYMQIILLVAAVVSLAIGQWSTGAVLIFLTVFNAVVGLRQEGKAESAMNALKSMMKQTARVRRDGAEAEIPAEEVVVGDVVLLAAGDDVPADGRIIAGKLAARSTSPRSPARACRPPRTTDALADADLGPGDQTNMAFMNTPVTHGSGMMIVTATGADAEVGKIAGMLAATAKEQTPLTRQLNTLTLWIGAAALGDDGRHVRARPLAGPVGRQPVHHRGRAGDRGDPDGAADRAPGDPVRRRQGARRRRRRSSRTSPSVETLGLDVGDQLRQDRHADDEPDDRGRGGRPRRPVHDLRHRLRPRGQGPARRRHLDLDRRRHPALRGRQRRQARGRQGRRRPDRGRAAGARPQGGARHRRHAGAPARGWPRCRSTRPTS